jgi:pilus assembly protein Flp/PilA
MRATAFIRKLLSDDEGATAVEYGLIVALVVIACIAALKGVANENTGLWATVVSKVDAVL